MSEEQPEKPKIIVDDDWKERVQAEKEAARQQADQAGEQAQGDAESQLPPASFATIVQFFATQTLASLGHIPDPEGKPTVQLEIAKHFIDTLAVLEEKTQGNLSQEESALLGQLLYELRMLFVAATKQPPPSAPGGDQDQGPAKPTIELP